MPPSGGLPLELEALPLELEELDDELIIPLLLLLLALPLDDELITPLLELLLDEEVVPPLEAFAVPLLLGAGVGGLQLRPSQSVLNSTQP
jgi:hypothetical protein